MNLPTIRDWLKLTMVILFLIGFGAIQGMIWTVAAPDIWTKLFMSALSTLFPIVVLLTGPFDFPGDRREP